MSEFLSEIRKTIEAGQNLCHQINLLTELHNKKKIQPQLIPPQYQSDNNLIEKQSKENQELMKKLIAEEKLRLDQTKTMEDKITKLQAEVLHWQKKYQNLYAKYTCPATITGFEDRKELVEGNSRSIVVLGSDEDKFSDCYWLAHNINDQDISAIWAKLYFNNREEPRIKDCVEPRRLHKKFITNLPAEFYPLIKNLSHLGNGKFYRQVIAARNSSANADKNYAWTSLRSVRH